MKHKVKRYQEGGEAELKKRGLEESKNERSGFFGLGRLLEGNIDSPGSKAYEKYGAGRGRAAQVREAAAPADNRPRAKSSFGYEDMDGSMPPQSPFVNQGEGTKDIDRSPAEAPKTEAMKKTNIGGYALSATGEEGGGSGVRSTTGPAKKKAASKPKYSGVVSAEELGSQDFTSKSKPAGSSGLSKGVLAAGLGIAGAAGAAALAARRKEQKKVSQSKIEPSLDSKKSLSGSTTGRMPGSSLRDPYSMNLGSDLDPKRTLKQNKRLSGDADFKKGGKTTRMASGGKVSSASSRGDGIAQRGKTRGRIC